MNHQACIKQGEQFGIFQYILKKKNETESLKTGSGAGRIVTTLLRDLISVKLLRQLAWKLWSQDLKLVEPKRNQARGTSCPELGEPVGPGVCCVLKT